MKLGDFEADSGDKVVEGVHVWACDRGTLGLSIANGCTHDLDEKWAEVVVLELKGVADQLIDCREFAAGGPEPAKTERGSDSLK